MVKKFSHTSFKRCLTSFLVTLKQVLVPTCQAAAVVWTFVNVSAVHSGSHLPRSSVPLGLQAFIPVSSGTYPSSSSGPLGQFAIVTAMHSGSHPPRSSVHLGIRHFYHCVLWYWPATQQWSCGHSLWSSQYIRDPSNRDAPRLISSRTAYRLFNCNIFTPACITICG